MINATPMRFSSQNAYHVCLNVETTTTMERLCNGILHGVSEFGTVRDKRSGYSFNTKSNVHSSELSIGGLFAAQMMKNKLYAGDVAKPGDAAKVKVLTEDIRNFSLSRTPRPREQMLCT